MAIIVTGARISHGTHQYTIGDHLRSGGFGDVFRAQRTAPEARNVVVKVPQPHVLEDDKLAKKFEREARILTNVQHENVVSIVAFWKFEGSDEMAIVQDEVVDAQPLHDYVATHPEEIPSLLLQSLYALRAFHPAVVHRDISPRNLLVDATGKLKVIDFGLAKEDPREPGILKSCSLF